MDIRFQCLGPDQWKAEILIVPVCQGENMLEACPALDNLAPWLAIAPAMRDFQGKKGQQALLHGHPELRVPRVLAHRPGRREDLTTDDIRTAVATGVQRAHELGLESILLHDPSWPPCPAAVSAWWKKASTPPAWPCTNTISKSPPRTPPRLPSGWPWPLRAISCPTAASRPPPRRTRGRGRVPGPPSGQHAVQPALSRPAGRRSAEAGRRCRSQVHRAGREGSGRSRHELPAGRGPGLCPSAAPHRAGACSRRP